MRVRCRWRAIRRARRRGKIRVKGRPQPGFRPRKEEKSGDALRVLIEEETPSQVDGFRLGGSGTPARSAVRFRARSGGLAGARPPATFWQPFRLRQGYGGPAGLRNWLPGNHFQQEFLKRKRDPSPRFSSVSFVPPWFKFPIPVFPP